MWKKILFIIACVLFGYFAMQHMRDMEDKRKIETTAEEIKHLKTNQKETATLQIGDNSYVIKNEFCSLIRSGVAYNEKGSDIWKKNESGLIKSCKLQ